jgi:hypothetical protein
MNKKNAVLKQLNSRRSKAIFGANGAGTYTGGDVSKTSATPPTASMPGANGSGTYTGGAASTATTAAASTAATAAAEPATTVAS